MKEYTLRPDKVSSAQPVLLIPIRTGHFGSAFRRILSEPFFVGGKGYVHTHFVEGTGATIPADHIPRMIAVGAVIDLSRELNHTSRPLKPSTQSEALHATLDRAA